MAIDYTNPRSPMLELMIDIAEKHGRQKFISAANLRKICEKKGLRYNATSMNSLVRAGQLEKLKKGDYKLAPVSFRLKASVQETKASYQQWQERTKSKGATHQQYLESLNTETDEDVARLKIEKYVRAQFEERIEAMIEAHLDTWRKGQDEQ